MRTIFLLSLGCPKNLVDSEGMVYQLKQAGYAITNNPDEAEIALVNTCAFIGDAKEESVDSILELAEKKEERLENLVVTGCLSQRYAEDLLREIPEIDGIIGTGRYEDVLLLLQRLDKERHVNLVDDIQTHKVYKEVPREILTRPHFAYLRIAEGCDNFCTYCIIPGIRGTYRSRKMEDIVAEAIQLGQQGVKEVAVIAEDITLYGKDLYRKISLTDLLEKLVEVEGIQRIRLMYVYPNNITDELLDLIAREEKICNYLDMPIQHISDGILKTMGRRITGDVIKSLIDKARQKIPGIVFRTSLITGFPGETEEDFARLLEFVKTYKIEQLGVFAYSREEGTPAWQLPQQIPQKTKEARRKKLMTAQFQNVLERNEARVGQVMEILVDDFDGIFFEGRSCSEALDVDPVILVKYDEEIRIGEIYQVRIVQTNDYDLIGEMESEFTQ